MTNEEAIEYGKKWDEAIESIGDTPFLKARQFLKLAIMALEEKSKRHWGNWIITEVQCPKCFNYVEPDCCSNNDLTTCPKCGADMRVEEVETDEIGKVFEHERRPLDEDGNVSREWSFLGRKIIAWQPLPEPYKKEAEND